MNYHEEIKTIFGADYSGDDILAMQVWIKNAASDPDLDKDGIAALGLLRIIGEGLSAPPSLSELEIDMIIDAIKCSGTYDPDEIMCAFEERLTHDQYQKIYPFLKWVHEKNQGFGKANYQAVFDTYWEEKGKE